MPEREAPILRVENLSISYETRQGDVQAVRDVSFDLHRATTHGIVGESGCGKTTIAFGLVGFLGRNGKITKGSIQFQGRELVGCSEKELRILRGDQIAMVYQDPMQALNPSVTLGNQLSEVLTVHRGISKKEASKKSIEMLNRVYMPDAANVMTRYPHQISGGQQQRVVIAMALLNDPALLIMDEPTTALDVTVEATVLDLIEDLKRDFDTSILYITHNLGVVARICNYVNVMYAGEIVESDHVQGIFDEPQHPYTQGLMRCVPKLGVTKGSNILYPIKGRVPAPKDRSKGICIFAPRCDYAKDHCYKEHPQLREIKRGHRARCFYSEEIDALEWEAEESLKRELAPPVEPDKEDAILQVKNLKTFYKVESRSIFGLFGLGEKQYVKAVDDVSMDAVRGTTVGIVGESGCGKSTLAKTIIGLEPLSGGDLEFLGMDIDLPVSKRSSDMIQELQMIFQNPDSTMNPSYTVGSQIARPLKRFKTVPRGQIRQEVNRLLHAVRLDERYYDRFPHQLSGGEKQRIGIARAFASQPDLVLCDEPVSALDVSVQAAVLNLLMEIQRQHGTTMLFISHDLSVVRFFSDYVAVMYLGEIVEFGPSEVIYAPPYHPYTEALLSAVPIPDPKAKQKHIRLEGSVPSPVDPPKGCRFHTRCPRRAEMLPDSGKICEKEIPPWRYATPKHRIFCHIPLEVLHQMDSVIDDGPSPTQR